MVKDAPICCRHRRRLLSRSTIFPFYTYCLLAFSLPRSSLGLLPSFTHQTPSAGPFISSQNAPVFAATVAAPLCQRASSSVPSSTSLYRIRRRRRRRRVRHRDAFVYDEIVSDFCPWIDDDDGDPFDHKGIAKSIDDEYKKEEAKQGMTFWEIWSQEDARKPEDISEKNRKNSSYARAQKRMTLRTGNAENKYMLMSDRGYGNPDLLDADHLNSPPSLDDLRMDPGSFSSTYWVKPIFRVGVIVVAYLSFPLWIEIFQAFQTTNPKDFNTVVGQIAPNIGVLYGTIIALTLQVLYSRFSRIQENVTTEASLLAQITRNLLSLFDTESEWAAEACQMIANQVRILLSRTRGVELLSIMKADTYSNLLALVDDYHYIHGCDTTFSSRKESVTSMLRTELSQIMEARALRLSDEASALPPAHFTLLTSMTITSLIAYVTASLAVIDDAGTPPQEASLLFAGLTALYVLFFNFCKDLNAPFRGVYQIKRSNAVSHLLQTKWLIRNQFGDRVSFGINFDEKPEEEEVELSVWQKIQALFGNEDSEYVEDEIGAALIAGAAMTPTASYAASTAVSTASSVESSTAATKATVEPPATGDASAIGSMAMAPITVDPNTAVLETNDTSGESATATAAATITTATSVSQHAYASGSIAMAPVAVDHTTAMLETSVISGGDVMNTSVAAATTSASQQAPAQKQAKGISKGWDENGDLCGIAFSAIDSLDCDELQENLVATAVAPQPAAVSNNNNITTDDLDAYSPANYFRQAGGFNI